MSENVTVEFATITPELAKDWLLNRNVHNRKQKPGAQAKYARDIAAGNWFMGVGTVVFDEDGILLDGQNRLGAVVTAGKPIQCIVVRGVDRRAQKVMDTGSKRTFADSLTIDGVNSDNNVLGAIVKLVLAHETGRYTTGGSQDATISELEDRFEQDEEGFLKATEATKPLKSHESVLRGKVTPQAFGTAYYYAAKLDPMQVDTFFTDQFLLGENIHQGMPAYALRQHFLNKDSSSRTKVEEAFKAIAHSWNKFRNNEYVRQLRLPDAFVVMK